MPLRVCTSDLFRREKSKVQAKAPTPAARAALDRLLELICEEKGWGDLPWEQTYRQLALPAEIDAVIEETGYTIEEFIESSLLHRCLDWALVLQDEKLADLVYRWHQERQQRGL